MIHRRRFVSGIAASALAAPAMSQVPGRVYRIAWLGFTATNSAEDLRVVGAFIGRLRELGFVDGRNLHIEWRYAEGRNERYAVFAKEMVAAGVDLIVTGTGTAAQAVKDVSTTMPIVVWGVPDPIRGGFVASFAHPGGQVTGLSNLSEDLLPKRIQLLKAAVPSITRMALARCPECGRLGGMSAANLQALFERYAASAREVGVVLTELPVNSDLEFPAAATRLRAERIEGVVLAANQINAKLRGDWAALEIEQRLPMIADYRASGTLLMYGPDYAAMLRRTAEFVGKVLNGAKPAELPMEEPTKVEFIVSLKVARAIGLTIPESVLLRADGVFD